MVLFNGNSARDIFPAMPQEHSNLFAQIPWSTRDKLDMYAQHQGLTVKSATNLIILRGLKAFEDDRKAEAAKAREKAKATTATRTRRTKPAAETDVVATAVVPKTTRKTRPPKG